MAEGPKMTFFLVPEQSQTSKASSESKILSESKESQWDYNSTSLCWTFLHSSENTHLQWGKGWEGFRQWFVISLGTTGFKDQYYFGAHMNGYGLNFHLQDLCIKTRVKETLCRILIFSVPSPWVSMSNFVSTFEFQRQPGCKHLSLLHPQALRPLTSSTWIQTQSMLLNGGSKPLQTKGNVLLSKGNQIKNLPKNKRFQKRYSNIRCTNHHNSSVDRCFRFQYQLPIYVVQRITQL